VIELEALTHAVAEYLQKHAGFNTGEVGVHGRGRPPASAGMVYAAVHAGDWMSGGPGHNLDLKVAVSVTLSVKLGQIPLDRWQYSGSYSADDGLEIISLLVLKCLHQRYDVITLANTKLSNGVSPFMEPLSFVRSGEPQEREAQWWSGSVTQSKGPLGLSRTLQFSGARIIQGTW